MLQLGIGYVDEHYVVTPPVHDPSHIKTFGYVPQHRLPAKPRCWQALVASARELGTQLNVYCRLDFYADVRLRPPDLCLRN